MTLLNGTFEGAFTERGAGELKVAEFWTPWWHANDTRPEYKPATTVVDPYRVHTGNAAQQWFTSYATHTGGVYQRLDDIQTDSALTFSAYVQTFSRNDDTDWRHSDGRYRMRIGIDPYGGVDPESGDIVWSGVVQPYDAYSLLQVEAVARSDRCTLFVWGQAEWAVKHNNAYVDDAVLVISGVPDLEPTEPGEGITEERAYQIAQEVAGAVVGQFKEHLRDILASIVAQL